MQRSTKPSVASVTAGVSHLRVTVITGVSQGERAQTARPPPLQPGRKPHAGNANPRKRAGLHPGEQRFPLFSAEGFSSARPLKLVTPCLQLSSHPACSGFGSRRTAADPAPGIPSAVTLCTWWISSDSLHTLLQHCGNDLQTYVRTRFTV